MRIEIIRLIKKWKDEKSILEMAAKGVDERDPKAARMLRGMGKIYSKCIVDLKKASK